MARLARRVRVVTLLLALFPFFVHNFLLAEAATLLPCPNFSCQAGSYVNGKFIDRSDPKDEGKADTDGALKYYIFNAGDFGDYFPDITDGDLTNEQLACHDVCSKRFNAEQATLGQPLAEHWMFEHQCNTGPGGVCYCFDHSVCLNATDSGYSATSGYWSDEYIEDYEYGDYFAVPAVYTTGKICEGGFKGDPHFTGADGSHFEFSGFPNRTFAIMSDAHIQVNAFMGGRYGQWKNRIKALTWIRQIAIMFGHHVAVLSVRSGSEAAYRSGYMNSIVVDGEPIVVPPKGSVAAADGTITISWTGVKVRSGGDFVDEYRVQVGEQLWLRLILRPEVRVLRTRSDAAIHFTLLVDRAQLSSNAHGVLGQTFRPDFAGRLAKQHLEWSSLLGTEVVPGDNAEGFIDGSVEDYMVQDLTRADCKVCRFARATSVDEETTKALAMSAISTVSVRKLQSSGLRG